MEYKWENPAVLAAKMFWLPPVVRQATVIDTSTGVFYTWWHGMPNDSFSSSAVGATDGAFGTSGGFKLEWIGNYMQNPLAITAVTTGASTVLTLNDVSSIHVGNHIKIGGIVETTNTGKHWNGLEAEVSAVDADKNQITIPLDTQSGYNTYGAGGAVEVLDGCCSDCCSGMVTRKAMWRLTLGTNVVGTAGKASVLQIERQLKSYDGFARWNGAPTVPETDGVAV